MAKMGDPTKEVSLGGRKCRLMYMGRRCEIWIDGVAFTFRADSPPKQVSVRSPTTHFIKRYYVTVESRSMSVLFDNYKVCQIPLDLASAAAAGTCTVKLAPNEKDRHEVSFVCPPKRIMIDGVERRMRYDTQVPCIEMDHGRLHAIRFEGPPRPIYIDDVPYEVSMDKVRRIKLNGRAHELAWGGPGFEVIVDGRPYELQFNQPAREVFIGKQSHMLYIQGEPPDVKILGRLPPELQSVAAAVRQDQDTRSVTASSQHFFDSKPTDLQKLLDGLRKHNFLPASSDSEDAKQMQQKQRELEELAAKEKERMKVGKIKLFFSSYKQQNTMKSILEKIRNTVKSHILCPGDKFKNHLFIKL